MIKTTIKFTIDGGEIQSYVQLSVYDLDGVLTIFFHNRNRRNRNIEIVSIDREKA